MTSEEMRKTCQSGLTARACGKVWVWVKLTLLPAGCLQSPSSHTKPSRSCFREDQFITIVRINQVSLPPVCREREDWAQHDFGEQMRTVWNE